MQKFRNGFIRRLEEIVQNLPESIPVASSNDKLAAFNIEPELLDDPNIDADDLQLVGGYNQRVFEGASGVRGRGGYE